MALYPFQCRKDVVVSEAKDLLFARYKQVLRFAQDDTDTASKPI